MNLKNEQYNFIKLITDNYPGTYSLTTDFLDLDVHKNDFTIFVEFSNIDLSNHVNSDDCTKYGKLLVQIYLVLRNDNSLNLNTKLLESTDSFYKLLYKNDIEVRNIDFYNYASGTKYIVASEFSVSLDIVLN